VVNTVVVWLHVYTCSHTTTVLTTVTLVILNKALPEDGVTARKHVGAVLMSILILLLRQIIFA